MKEQNLPLIMTKNGADNFQTPPEALKPLLKYININKVIWESACGKGYLIKELTDKGYSVVGSDILTGGDYFISEPNKWDLSITNPPFSKKNEWIERAYQLGKPFALLLPLAALETQRRQECWKKGLQLIVLNKRLHFETPNNKASHCWFASAWFTYGLNLPNDIVFGEI